MGTMDSLAAQMYTEIKKPKLFEIAIRSWQAIKTDYSIHIQYNQMTTKKAEVL